MAYLLLNLLGIFTFIKMPLGFSVVALTNAVHVNSPGINAVIQKSVTFFKCPFVITAYLLLNLLGICTFSGMPWVSVW